MPILENTNTNIEVLSITALSLGLIFVGSANSEITQSICQTLMEKDGTSLNNSHCYLLCLGLGLLYLCIFLNYFKYNYNNRQRTNLRCYT